MLASAYVSMCMAGAATCVLPHLLHMHAQVHQRRRSLAAGLPPSASEEEVLLARYRFSETRVGQRLTGGRRQA